MGKKMKQTMYIQMYMYHDFCICTYPFSDGIADFWIRILACTFGQLPGSTNVFSGREGLKEGEESDASDEHDGGESIDQRVDFQFSAGCSWYGAIAEGSK